MLYFAWRTAPQPANTSVGGTKSYSCKSKVCAKTIVIVKDCCLVAGGLCRSMAGRGLVSGSRRTKFRRWMERSGTPAEPPATIASLDNSPQRTKNANQPVRLVYMQKDPEWIPSLFWWEQRESNPRPSACKADALNQLSYAPELGSWTRTWTWDPLINSQML